jgi:hypothetical protein
MNSSYHPNDSEENEGIVAVVLETRWEKSPVVIPEEDDDDDCPGSNSAIVQSSFRSNWIQCPMRMVPNEDS